MKIERPEPRTGTDLERENEWSTEHERRKRTWTEEDRRSRKERRHPSPFDADENLSEAAPFRTTP